MMRRSRAQTWARTNSWACTAFGAPILVVGLLLGLLTAAPAGAVDLVGDQVKVSWVPASGPVVAYLVYVNRNGRGFGPVPEVVNWATNRVATVRTEPGEWVQVRVAAWDMLRGVVGPNSSTSPSYRALTVEWARSVMQPVFNGSFESGTNPGDYTSLVPGSTSIAGWEVIGELPGQGVDYVGTVWQAADGQRSLDLSSFDAGGVRQNLRLPLGATYEVSFNISGNPAVPGLNTMRVSAGDSGRTYSFDASGYTFDDMGWSRRTFRFRPTTDVTTLVFESLRPGNSGPLLDDVDIRLVSP